jgi:hypothetical protein
MFSKTIITLLTFTSILITIESRAYGFKARGCYCRERIQRERDRAVDKHNKMFDELDKIKNITSKTFCGIGTEFSIDDTIINNKITCNKCGNNYYRAEKNSTCLHCPEGYTSKEGSGICKRDTENIHTYCPNGKIVGHNPYGKYLDSCVKCDKNKKEYMPFKNNQDKCMICPSGSIITNKEECVKCPVGYYQKDNECVECSYKSYNDIEASTYCKKCDNIKSNSYYFNGGITCEDNILYKYSEEINDYFKLNSYTNSFISSSQIVNSIIYNNRKIIIGTTTITGIVGGTILAVISG